MKNQCRRSRHTGFTLVELMIAVAIIGILATMAINEYDKNAARAKFAEMIRSSSSIKTDIIEYYGTHGELPPTTAWRDFDNDDNMRSWRIARSSDTPTRGTIVIAPTDSVYPGSNSNRRLHIEVNIQPGGSLDWTCGTREYSLRRISFDYLPRECHNLMLSPYDDNP